MDDHPNLYQDDIPNTKPKKSLLSHQAKSKLASKYRRAATYKVRCITCDLEFESRSGGTKYCDKHTKTDDRLKRLRKS